MLWNVVGWGVVAHMTVKFFREPESFGLGDTTVSPGPTIQGMDVSTINTIKILITMLLKCSNTDKFADPGAGAR